MRRVSRRVFLGAVAGFAATTACSPGRGSERDSDLVRARPAATDPVSPSATTQPVATTPPTPAPRPMGTEERILLPGTPSETRVVMQHSGVRGPAALVLGGVHGNEPGGWLAADEVATWQPTAGTLVVIPRANAQAIARFVRTTDEIGDLNRLYPGDPSSSLLMERMAAVILETAHEFEVELLLDMHESWAFYAELPGTGTGALGQTITAGVGPLQVSLARDLADRVNPEFRQREQMIVRDGTPFRRPEATPSPGQANRGRSSLSAGGYVPGLTPILVEMGQLNQPVERRIELHVAVARAALELIGVV